MAMMVLNGVRCVSCIPGGAVSPAIAAPTLAEELRRGLAKQPLREHEYKATTTSVTSKKFKLLSRIA